MTARVLVRRATALLTLAFVAACSSDSSTGPTGDFSLTAPANSATVPAGTSGRATVQVNRTNGFNGAIAFTLEGIPAGVTATVSPSIATSNVTTVNIDYAVAAGTTVGATPTITLRATSKDRSDKTATVKLTVGAAPNFTATVQSNTITVTEGDSTKLRTTVVRVGGLTGVVDLSASNLPAGVTATFGTIANDTASITFRAALGLTGGSYPITVNAVNPATGLQIAIPVTLNVVEIPGYNLIVTPIPAPPNAHALPVTGSTLTQSVHAVRRGGYAGPITYALTGTPPAGVTLTSAQSGDDFTITYTAAVVGGVYSTTAMTLTATAAGLANRTVPIRVTPLTGPLLTSGVAVPIPNGTADSVYVYAIYVPKGGSSITFTSAGPSNGPDVDIYARANQVPGFSIASANCTSEGATTNETCTVTPAVAGVYFVRIAGFNNFTGVTIKATINP